MLNEASEDQLSIPSQNLHMLDVCKTMHSLLDQLVARTGSACFLIDIVCLACKLADYHSLLVMQPRGTTAPTPVSGPGLPPGSTETVTFVPSGAPTPPGGHACPSSPTKAINPFKANASSMVPSACFSKCTSSFCEAKAVLHFLHQCRYLSSKFLMRKQAWQMLSRIGWRTTQLKMTVLVQLGLSASVCLLPLADAFWPPPRRAFRSTSPSRPIPQMQPLCSRRSTTQSTMASLQLLSRRRG